MLLLFSLLFFLTKHLFCFILLRTLLIAIFFKKLIFPPNNLHKNNSNPPWPSSWPFTPPSPPKNHQNCQQFASNRYTQRKDPKKSNFFPFFSLSTPPPLFNIVLFSVIAFTICIYTWVFVFTFDQTNQF